MQMLIGFASAWPSYHVRSITDLRVVVMRHHAKVGERPISHPGLPNDVFDRYRTENARIGAIPAVVSEHIDRSFRNDYGIAPRAVALGDRAFNVRLVELHPVDENESILDCHGFTR